MEKQLELWIKNIRPLDKCSMEKAKRRWDSIAKPLHSLGKLEEMVVQIAGIKRTHSISTLKKGLIIMCGDNGVVEEGVTQTGQEVTAIVSENFLKEKATASILAKRANTTVIPVDIGIAVDTNILQRKIAYGTKNMAKEPAMTIRETLSAIMVGIDLVKEKKAEGYDILATGEMGIGNTTTSSALAAVLLDQPVEAMTGRGAGLSTKGLERKIKVINKSIELHKPRKEEPIDTLSKLGGLDIAGLVGVFLGGAIYEVPIVIDGFISSVAALIATKITKSSKDYMIPSHKSNERAGGLLLDALELEPCLLCNMCLGEGTGAIMLFPILDMALEVYKDMVTFEENDIEEYTPLV